jgi:hypothetical protein
MNVSRLRGEICVTVLGAVVLLILVDPFGGFHLRDFGTALAAAVLVDFVRAATRYRREDGAVSLDPVAAAEASATDPDDFAHHVLRRWLVALGHVEYAATPVGAPEERVA